MGGVPTILTLKVTTRPWLEMIGMARGIPFWRGS